MPDGTPTKAQVDKFSVMRTRVASAISATSKSRASQLDDLKFAAASPDDQFQWPSDVLSTRGAVQGQTINARPCLTINKMPEHIHQVTNEQRQNQPSPKVIPASEEAQVEMAEVFDGLIRYIEYVSSADVAYATACDNQVTYGEGYARIITEWVPGTWKQEIKIKRIRNSFSVYMDPMIQDPCGLDAEWCGIGEDVTKADYERQWPDATPISTISEMGIGDDSLAPWLGEDTIRIMEYYYKVYTRRTLNLYVGNMVAIEGSLEDKRMRSMGLAPLKSRTEQVSQVKWCKTNGVEDLESTDWAGQWIPVVRLIGNEFEIEGQLYISGLVRNAKDAQRMYNYWVSQEAEMLALAPKAPFIGYAGQFESFETQWKTANTQNHPYLVINPIVGDGDNRVLPLPQRAQPPMASSGLLQAKLGAADDIKSATGQYNASLGQTSNERTGKAILAREHQAAVGTYHYVDNYARFVRVIGIQLVDLIPKVMDTEQMVLIMGEDGTPKSVKFNPQQETAVNEIRDEETGAIQRIFNPNVGKYAVRVTTGPSYVTKRQETQESMGRVLEANPELWKVAGDLFVQNMDWPGADKLAKRLARTIDPKLLAGEDESPEMQAAKQQLEMLGEENDKLHTMLQNVQTSFEALQLKNESYKMDNDAYKAETDRLKGLVTAMGTEVKSPAFVPVVEEFVREILAEPTPQEQNPDQPAPQVSANSAPNEGM